MRPLLILISLMGLLWCGAVSAGPPVAPEFTRSDPESWLNSPPLSLAQLRGQVVLVEFWTFGCVNCLRSQPWLRAVERRYADDGLRVVGIHTPEFSHERPRAAVAAKVEALGIEHPVMLDNDFRYWNAMGNRFWPAFYLIDRLGRVRGLYPGEVHSNTPRAREIETRIRRLLAEPR